MKNFTKAKFTKNFVLGSISGVLALLGFYGLVSAQSKIDSPNYSLVGPTISSSAGASSSSNYVFYQSLGEISDPKLSSASYNVRPGSINTFIANVPLITCFETNTNSGSSLCNSSYPNTDGTRGEAGEGGFFDRAKFVIDAQNNPSDTLYSIQISSDNFVTVEYVDGITRQPQATKDIADFLTKSTWEGAPWNSANIIGLAQNTAFKIRVTALHGDLTESQFGPEASATTGVASITMDIDISDSTWPNSAESSAPYSVSLGTLSPTSVNTASNRIYIDLGSNAVNGTTTYVEDINDGLYSATTLDTIPSPTTGNPTNADLASVLSGFGIKISNVNTTTPSSLVRDSDYYNGGLPDQVGRVRSSSTDVIMTTASGINTGRAQIEVKAKAAGNLYAATVYTDTLTFTAAASF